MSMLVRMIAMVLAIIGLAYNDIEDVVFAVFLWLVADSIDRLRWSEQAGWRREYRRRQRERQQWARERAEGDPWNHVSR